MDGSNSFNPSRNTQVFVLSMIESKLSDLIRRREVPLNISEFKDFLKAKYRYYIESDEKYWSCKYSACPLESKRGSNDNKYLYL